jgi:hypothetical protein
MQTCHHSDYLAGQTDNSHKLAFSQLTCHGSKNTSASRATVSIEDNNRVAVKTYVRTVFASRCLSAPHNHTPYNLATLYLATRDCLLHAQHDNITQTGKPTFRPAEHLNTPRHFCTAIVRDIEQRLHLNHGRVSGLNELNDTPIRGVLILNPNPSVFW